ncbi:Ribonuclease T2 [Mactra antiquata]
MVDEIIKEGISFDCFESLKKAIKAFGKQGNIQYVVGNYKSINAANKYISDNSKPYPKKFKYRISGECAHVLAVVYKITDWILEGLHDVPFQPACTSMP